MQDQRFSSPNFFYISSRTCTLPSRSPVSARDDRRGCIEARATSLKGGRGGRERGREGREGGEKEGREAGREGGKGGRKGGE